MIFNIRVMQSLKVNNITGVFYPSAVLNQSLPSNISEIQYFFEGLSHPFMLISFAFPIFVVVTLKGDVTPGF